MRITVIITLSIIFFIPFSTNALTDDIVYLQRSRGARSVSALNIFSGYLKKLFEIPVNSGWLIVSPDERMIAWGTNRVQLYDHATGQQSSFFPSYTPIRFFVGGSLTLLKNSTSSNLIKNEKFSYYRYNLKTRTLNRFSEKDGERSLHTIISPSTRYSIEIPLANPPIVKGPLRSITLRFPENIDLRPCTAQFSPNETSVFIRCVLNGYLFNIKSGNLEGKLISTPKSNNNSQTFFYDARWINTNSIIVQSSEGLIMYSLNSGVFKKEHVIWSPTNSNGLAEFTVRKNQVLFIERHDGVQTIQDFLYGFDMMSRKKRLILKSEPNEDFRILSYEILPYE